MAILAKATSGTFETPPPGAHPGICIDIIDVGIVEQHFQGQKPRPVHKIKIVWAIDELRSDGKQFHLHKRYTLSLHEKASLRKDLESWRGKPFTEAELQGFDLEVLIGIPALLNVLHETGRNDGTVFANVVAVMKIPRGMVAPAMPTGYVRMCDRKETQAEAVPSSNFADDDAPSDDDVPF